MGARVLVRIREYFVVVVFECKPAFVNARMLARERECVSLCICRLMCVALHHAHNTKK